jgi:peptidoglycan/LPS O-acetylase OafA/YrhL
MGREMKSLPSQTGPPPELQRQNNFNLIRAGAAIAVLVSHAYPISEGPKEREPLEAFLGTTLGGLAVLVFFIVSGYFISQSSVRSKTQYDFWTARFLRIYPGLLIALSVTVVFVGIAVTSLPPREYFSAAETLTYVPKGLSLLWIQYELPGTFGDNPFSGVVNGSLWTLFYEALCYLMLSSLHPLRILHSEKRAAAFFLLFLFCYSVVKFALMESSAFDSRTPAFKFLGHLLDLTPAFVLGMAYYVYRDRIPVNLISCLVLAIGSAAAYSSPVFREVFLIFISFLVFYVGFKTLKFMYFYNIFGDYSYGIYIYAFPMEQLGAYLLPGISPIGVIMLAGPATIAASIASWHWIERPALRLRALLASIQPKKSTLHERHP